MRTITLISLLISSFSAFAFDLPTFMNDGLTHTKAALQDRFKNQLVVDTSCPASGSQVVPNLTEKKSNLLGAMKTVQAVITDTEAAVNARKTDVSRCGSCKQTNVVSAFAAVNPEKFVLNPACDNRPSETFSKDFASQKDIQTYTQALLQGSSEDGQRLSDNCPNPCTYYITTSQTVLANGATHVALTIQCGQPRKDSVFTAAYVFKAGVIHQWSCNR